jgi:hypothetical protein
MQVEDLRDQPMNRDPRREKNPKSPRLSKHVVSYFDLLGMERRMVETRNHPDAARLLLRSYAKVFEVIRKELGTFDTSTWKFKVFTDNIVLAVPVYDSDLEGEIGDAIITAGMLQVQLSIRGWFVRGAVCIGGLYMDEEMVFGPALVEAYKLEKCSARDPRVVLSDECMKAVVRHAQYHAPQRESPQAAMVAVDVDGIGFVNYLSLCVLQLVEQPLDAIPILASHRDSVIKMLKKNRMDPLVWAKYRWVAQYHDFFCRTWFPKNVDLLLPKSLLANGPSPLLSAESSATRRRLLGEDDKKQV